MSYMRLVSISTDAQTMMERHISTDAQKGLRLLW
jgi:hypothetical protein